MNKQTEALKMAIDAMVHHTYQTRPIEKTFKAIDACEKALAQPAQDSEVQEQQTHWLTKEHFADILNDIADCIAENNSESIRHKANWIRKGE